MRDRNPEISLMPEFDSEEAFNASFAKEAAAVAPYRDSQGRLVLDDIHDLPKVVEKVFAGHPNLIKQVEKGTNMFDVFVFPIDCITRIRAGEKVLWTNPAT